MEKFNLCTKNISGIYLITNLKNGKRYVGSSNNLYERSYSHIYHLEKQNHVNEHLQNAYNKYGKEFFIITVLEYCEEKELLTREAYYIKCLNPEYNISSVDGTYTSKSEEIKLKISESIKNSWKDGKLKERRESAKCWSIPCYVYDTSNWTLYKECSSFKEAAKTIGLGGFDVNYDTIGIRLFKERFVVYLEKMDNYLDIKNRICEDIMYYNGMDVTKRKYLIAETEDGNLYYFRKFPPLIKQFGSSKSTLSRKLPNSSKENPYIIPNTNVKVYYSYDFVKITKEPCN